METTTTTTKTTTTSTTTTSTATTTVSSTTTTVTTTETTTVSEPANIVYGDANCDSKINMGDVVLIMQSMVNPDVYGLNGSDKSHITLQGTKNGDVIGNDGLTNNDALGIQMYILNLVSSLPIAEMPSV